MSTGGPTDTSAGTGPTDGDTEVIAGRYQLGRRLGRGGMGIVFAARDLLLDRTVAVKMMDVRHSDPTFRRRFQNEAASLAKVRSRHILSIYDFGQVDETLYLVTELIPDGDLQARLRSRGALPVTEALAVVRQVALGLADAHAVGIVHRDVKPANVLLWDHSDALRAYVCDFGIAAIGGKKLTLTGAIVGSAAFMAPERHFGHQADKSSDLYSLGCVLWAALTGAAPYAGTDYQVINSHLYAPPPRFVDDSPTAGAVNAVLDRLLGKDPARRTDDAAAVAAELDDLLAAAREAGPGLVLSIAPTADDDDTWAPDPAGLPTGAVPPVAAAPAASGAPAVPTAPGPAPTAAPAVPPAPAVVAATAPAPPAAPAGESTQIRPPAAAASGAGAPGDRPPADPSDPRRVIPLPERAPGPRHRRGLWLVAAVVVLLVLAVGGVAASLSLGGSSNASADASGDPPPTPDPATVTAPATPDQGGPSTTSTTGGQRPTTAPEVRTTAGYRSVVFTVPDGADGQVAQVRRGSRWQPVADGRVSTSTTTGSQQVCEAFRYATTTAGGPGVRVCGTSQPPTIDFVNTGKSCRSAQYRGYDCSYYDVVAAGFKPGTSPRALVFNADGSPFCQCAYHQIKIGDDGRGRQSGSNGSPGEWQVPSAISAVIVEIAGVRQRIELR